MNTFSVHPAAQFTTPDSVMRALFNWRAAVNNYTAYQSRQGKYAVSSAIACLWYSYRVTRAYLALRDAVTAQVDTEWYGQIMWAALDDGVNPFSDGLLIAFLVNALLP